MPPDAAQRPPFSLADASEPARRISLWAWALAVAAFGAAGGATLYREAVLGQLCLAFAANCAHEPLALTLPLAAAFAVAGLAFALLPTAGGPPGARRGAGAFAAAGGAAALVLVFLETAGAGTAGGALPALAFGAPAAWLGAVDPAARFGPRSLSSPARWLRAGSVLPMAGAAGLAAAFLAATAAQSGVYAGDPYSTRPALLGLGLAALLLVAAGALAVRQSPADGPPADKERQPPRGRRQLGLTAMLSYALTAETGLTAAAAACLSALMIPFWTLEDGGSAAASLVAGIAAGGALSMAASPWVDERFGRGALLSLSYTASAGGPLLVSGYLSYGEPLFLALAAALFALALGSLPPRIAIAFDLSPSRTRLRSSLDFQALRFAAGVGGVVVVLLGYGVFEPLGLSLASAYGVIGTATFAPTLGSLGRRRA